MQALKAFMNLETILISALVGVLTSLITAYITTRFKMREEREKWQREFSVKYLETQASDSPLAQKMARQFAIGFLKYRDKNKQEPFKVFILPNCRLIVGRSSDCDICLIDRKISRHHCAFDADDTNVYLLSLGATHKPTLNGVSVSEREKMKNGDTIEIGDTDFLYYKIEKS